MTQLSLNFSQQYLINGKTNHMIMNGGKLKPQTNNSALLLWQWWDNSFNHIDERGKKMTMGKKLWQGKLWDNKINYFSGNQ